MSFFGKIGHAIGHAAQQVGHVAAKPLGISERLGGAALGGLTGGPAGALAGWRAGDKLANITEDTLGGHSVRKHLGSNLLGVGEGLAGGYLASGGGIPGLPGGGGGIADAGDNAETAFGIGAPTQAGAGGLRGMIGSAAGAIGHAAAPGPDGNGIDYGQLALSGIKGATNAYTQFHKQGQQDELYNRDKKRYDALAGLRQQGIDELSKPYTPPDFSKLDAIRRMGPYA